MAIPEYLQGKSAIEICNSMKERFLCIETGDVEALEKDYVKNIERLLLLAIKDALCNVEEVKELVQEGEYKAQQRAIVFLNMVMPYKE